jgi:DNA-binding NarL/FixJ family response regulator
MIWETRAAQAGMYDQMAEIVEKQGVAALADLMAHTPIFPACQILAFLAHGDKNPEIASRLAISLKTVRNHVSNIFSKLQVADRAQAILRAREAGLG